MSKPHSGPYLAAEGETWVLKTDYDALELSHAAAIAQRDRYRTAHARLEEQLEAERQGRLATELQRDQAMKVVDKRGKEIDVQMRRAERAEEQLEALREAARDFLAATETFNPERYQHEKAKLIALAWPEDSIPAREPLEDGDA